MEMQIREPYKVYFVLFIKVLLVTWLCLSFILFAFQRYLVFVPDNKSTHLSDFDKKFIERVVWQNEDKILLYGFYHPPTTNQPTIVIFHGNAGNIGTRKTLMLKLIEQGYGVFMPEYRGYGGVSGQPSEKGLYEDAQSALKFLKSQGIPYFNMILLGESLGSAVALEMAKKYPVSGVILQSPFTSLHALARLHYPWNFLPLFDKFNNEEKIKDIHVPLLVIHGMQDELVPVEHGKSLYQKAIDSPHKKLKLIEGAAHDIPWEDDYISSIRDFIEKNILSNFPTGVH
jgi:fermentation-respiration switch protein FrsA (DUF1100 family)